MREQVIRFRSFWVFPLLGVIVLALSKQKTPDIDATELVWLVPIGLFVWSLLEYGLHRFAFHLEPQSTNAGRWLAASHSAHHSAPRDPDKVFVHTALALAVSAALYGLLYIAIGSAFRTSGVIAGIWMGFLYYEYVHYTVHLTAGNPGVLDRQRRAHFHHHFGNPHRCYGVTTSIWDCVFRTNAAGN